MIKLPENWQEYDQIEQAKWFLRNVIKYAREGEIKDLPIDCPSEIKIAYKNFLAKGGYKIEKDSLLK